MVEPSATTIIGEGEGDVPSRCSIKSKYSAISVNWCRQARYVEESNLIWTMFSIVAMGSGSEEYEDATMMREKKKEAGRCREGKGDGVGEKKPYD